MSKDSVSHIRNLILWMVQICCYGNISIETSILGDMINMPPKAYIIVSFDRKEISRKKCEILIKVFFCLYFFLFLALKMR